MSNIRNFVICPPTSYIGLDGEIFNYTFLGGEIKEVPQYLFDCLLKLNKHKNTFILSQNNLIAKHDMRIITQNKLIAEQDKKIAEQDTKIAEQDTKIADQDKRIKALEQTIISFIQKE